MATADGFHPDFDAKDQQVARNRVHHVKASDISSDTAQSDGMRRFAALSGQSVGTETASYVRSGNPEFVFHDGTEEIRISARPGDYIFVPPYLPHREENPDPTTPAEVVIARSTQEAIVVNLPELYPL
jgi:cupin superfamily acireductone dioxygenase involved in methionine salvage